MSLSLSLSLLLSLVKSRTNLSNLILLNNRCIINITELQTNDNNKFCSYLEIYRDKLHSVRQKASRLIRNVFIWPAKNFLRFKFGQRFERFLDYLMMKKIAPLTRRVLARCSYDNKRCLLHFVLKLSIIRSRMIYISYHIYIYIYIYIYILRVFIGHVLQTTQWRCGRCANCSFVI